MNKKFAIFLMTAMTWGCGGAPSTSTSTPPAKSSASPVAASTSAPANSASPAGSSSPAESASPSASGALKPGWTEVKSKDGKLKMAVPPDWIVADSDNPKFKEAMAELTKSNPALANADTKNYYFMTISSKPKDGFSDNANVVKKSVGQTLPFNDDTAKALKAELVKAMPVQGDLKIEVTKIPFGPAFRYEAELKFNTGSGSFNTYVVAYLVFQGTDMYITTFSTTPKNKATFPEVAKTAMDSFTLTP